MLGSPTVVLEKEGKAEEGVPIPLWTPVPKVDVPTWLFTSEDITGLVEVGKGAVPPKLLEYPGNPTSDVPVAFRT